MNKIVTITINPCIDTTIWVDELIPDKKLKAKSTEDEAGGGGINVSRALQFLEQKSTCVFLSGGKNGNHLKSLVSAESIDNNAIEMLGETRNNLLIIDNSTLKEYRIGMPSAEINEASIQNLLSTIEKTEADFFVLSGSIPSNISTSFFEILTKTIANKKAKLIVDTSSDALQEIIKHETFLLKPNLNELSILCGINENETIDKIIEATKILLDKISCQAIVVSLGKDGAVLITKENHFYQKAPKVEVKSTVGAGDCMVACLTLALNKNLKWNEVLEYGVAGGSAATLNSGKSLINKQDFGNILNTIKKENGSF